MELEPVEPSTPRPFTPPTPRQALTSQVTRPQEARRAAGTHEPARDTELPTGTAQAGSRDGTAGRSTHTSTAAG